MRIGSRPVPVDVAFGGACYGVVDSESAGLGLISAHLPDLRRLGEQIRAAVDAEIRFVHPGHDALKGVHGVVFTGPASGPQADLRAVTVCGGGQIAASPSESAIGALMAVLDTIGLLPDDAHFTAEGLVGTAWTGRITGRSRVGDYLAIVPEVEGSAWVTGEYTALAQTDDPLVDGFCL